MKPLAILGMMVAWVCFSGTELMAAEDTYMPYSIDQLTKQNYGVDLTPVYVHVDRRTPGKTMLNKVQNAVNAQVTGFGTCKVYSYTQPNPDVSIFRVRIKCEAPPSESGQ